MSSEAPHKSRAAKRKRDTSFSSSSSESYDAKPKKTKSRDKKHAEIRRSKKKRHRSERHKGKKHKHSKKKTRSDTDSETFSSSDGESSGDGRVKPVSPKRHHKHKKKTKHPKKDSLELSRRKHKHTQQPEKHGAVTQTALSSVTTPARTNIVEAEVQTTSTTVKKRGPMTKEEWEKQQSIVRRVYDPDTGRHRLVKGDGEIVEEIVSREQQRNINKQATLGDSMSFQQGLRKLM